MKRFYQSATIHKTDGDFAVQLDEKPIQTPAKNLLLIPSEPLALAIAFEWNAQSDTVDKNTMPLTRFATIATDVIAANRDDIIHDLLAYTDTDLILHRSPEPKLAALQAKTFAPIAAWLSGLGITLNLTDSLLPVPQPEGNKAKVREIIEALSSPPPGRGRPGGGLKQFRETDEDITNHARDMRKNPTDVEKKVWDVLKQNQVEGCRFRRQHPMGRYIADFVCTDKKIIIELDGGQHAEQTSYDRERTNYFEQSGYKVLRFWNNEVMENLEGVYETIHRAILDSKETPTPPSPFQGEGLISNFHLSALTTLTHLTGSLYLALYYMQHLHFDIATACRLEENTQAEQWGITDTHEEKEGEIRTEIAAINKFLVLLQP